MITSNDVESILLDSAESVYQSKLERINNAKPLFPLISDLKNNVNKTCNYFTTKYGALIWIISMSKKDALIFLDEFVFSKYVVEEDPWMDQGEIRCMVKIDDVKLKIEISLQEGDGCKRVAVGKEWTTKYEWRCN